MEVSDSPDETETETVAAVERSGVVGLEEQKMLCFCCCCFALSLYRIRNKPSSRGLTNAYRDHYLPHPWRVGSVQGWPRWSVTSRVNDFL